jgi:hypothetical protein
MFNELKPNEIEVGKQYHYEEKYYSCADVTILEDQTGREGEDWVGWKIRVDKSYGGLAPLEEGKVLTVGHNVNYSHYSSVKFKALGSMPDYTGFQGEKDWSIRE